MGAAIQCFSGAQAILIPRSRFAPVKTTSDLLSLSSDAYEETPDRRMVLRPERNGVPPNVKLDGTYKFVDSLSSLIPEGSPSLLRCKKLEIKGKVVLSAGIVFEGNVTVSNKGDTAATVPAGVYSDQTLEL